MNSYANRNNRLLFVTSKILAAFGKEAKKYILLMSEEKLTKSCRQLPEKLISYHIYHVTAKLVLHG